MRRRRLVLAGALGVVAVLGALYAHDLRTWRHTLESGQIAYSAAPGQTVATTAPTILPSSLSGDLLSVQRERQWLKALPHFVTVYDFVNPLDHLGPGVYDLLNGAERDLTTVTQDPRPASASQAYDLLAVLYFRSAYPGSGTDPVVHQHHRGWPDQRMTSTGCMASARADPSCGRRLASLPFQQPDS